MKKTYHAFNSEWFSDEVTCAAQHKMSNKSMNTTTETLTNYNAGFPKPHFNTLYVKTNRTVRTVTLQYSMSGLSFLLLHHQATVIALTN